SESAQVRRRTALRVEDSRPPSWPPGTESSSFGGSPAEASATALAPPATSRLTGVGPTRLAENRPCPAPGSQSLATLKRLGFTTLVVVIRGCRESVEDAAERHLRIRVGQPLPDQLPTGRGSE